MGDRSLDGVDDLDILRGDTDLGRRTSLLDRTRPRLLLIKYCLRCLGVRNLVLSGFGGV